MLKIKKDIFIYLYYIVLLIIILYSSINSFIPGMPLRVLFLLMVFLPAKKIGSDLFLSIFVCFHILAIYSFNGTLLPTESRIYSIVFLILIFILYKKNHLSSLKYIGGLSLYLLVVDLFNSQGINNINFCFLILFIMGFMVNKNDIGNISKYISIAFIISTIILAIIFLTLGTQYSKTIVQAGLDRIQWTDPNYFGTVVGMGSVLSIIYLSLFKNGEKWVKCICVFNIFVTIPMLIVNASRGSLISVGVTLIMYFLFSKIGLKYKIFIFFISFAFLLYLFDNGYFDMLIYRVEFGEGNATNGRSLIWENKFNSFCVESNFIQLLFGHGYYNGYRLAYPNGQGFHNEFLAFLVDYGFIGVLFFCLLMFIPMIKAKNIYISMITIYLVICCMSLEPFSLGVLAYYLFYFYLIILSNYIILERKNENIYR